MKKNSFLIVLVFFTSIGSTNAQLEVIDKIAEVLIPGITNGIKSVMESSNGKKVKKTEVEDLKKDLLNYTKGVVDRIDDDVSNITALNELFSISGKLFDNIGSMKSMTNQRFLAQIENTNGHLLYRETAILFSFHWRQLEAKKDQLVSNTDGASSGSVQDDIAQYVGILDENLIDLTTALGLVKNPSESMDLPSSKNYISGMHRSRDYIIRIEDAVKAINIQLSSRIKALNKSLEDAKKELEKLLKEEN